MPTTSLPVFTDPEAKSVLTAICKRRGVPVKLLQSLAELERDYIGSGRRDGIMQDIDACLSDHLD